MYKGVALSVLASITFGVLYFYTEFLKPLNSEETFAWRMLATIPFVTLLMWWMGDLKLISDILKRVKKQPILILWLILSSILCTSQLWLFLWGPINGRGLQVSLGYFLLPLVMVLKLTKTTKHAKRHFWLNDVCTCHGLLPSHSA